jgi:flagellar motility protein MotE (MotC chaperone)
MKKIIILGIGGVLFFVFLVILVFAILTFMEKAEKPVEVINTDRALSEENNSLLGVLIDEKQAIIDSLTINLETTMDTLQHYLTLNDSLRILSATQAKKITTDSLEIANLQKRLNQLQARLNAQQEEAETTNENIRELAKTYEQMKVSDMKPIFTQLDDETIIELYNAMSSRKRPMVFKALSTDRAAMITEKLAK